MKKQILPFLLTPLLLPFATNSMALTCSDNAAQNSVEANNYIFQILDYIDTPAKGIQKEIRTSVTTPDKSDVQTSTAKQTLEYDRNGMITKSDYDLYSGQNEHLYSERLSKTDSGWQNSIEDFEDQKSSVVKFITDKQGRIIESQQEKRAADFVFIQNDTYQYDDNNCIVNKQGKWQLKAINVKGEFTGAEDQGSSKYSYQYDNNQLAKILYDFSNNTHAENAFLYQHDTSNRLTSLQSIYTTGTRLTPYTTKFLTFNDKNDWLSASQQRGMKEIKNTDIKRVITYY